MPTGLWVDSPRMNAKRREFNGKRHNGKFASASLNPVRLLWLFLGFIYYSRRFAFIRGQLTCKWRRFANTRGIRSVIRKRTRMVANNGKTAESEEHKTAHLLLMPPLPECARMGSIVCGLSHFQ